MIILNTLTISVLSYNELLNKSKPFESDLKYYK